MFRQVEIEPCPRLLQQILAEKLSNRFPDACKIIHPDFYMDLLLTGSDSASDLSTLCLEIYNILQSDCFPLNKWGSNNSSIIRGLVFLQLSLAPTFFSLERVLKFWICYGVMTLINLFMRFLLPLQHHDLTDQFCQILLRYLILWVF